MLDNIGVLNIAFCEDMREDAEHLKQCIENAGISYSLAAFESCG